MKLAICVATMHTPDEPIGDLSTCMATRADKDNPIKVYVHYNTPEVNLGPVGSYQKLYEQATEDVLAFMHDDLIIREGGWDERLLHEFEDSSIAVAGFGGALAHGDDDLYKTPYVLQQLKRHYYRSSVDDAEVHGERFTGSCDVAVLDGFALILRRSFLERIGGFGWIPDHAGFFCYDYAICAMARRLGCRVRCVGIRCHHRGGGTSVNGTKENRFTSPEAYELSHRWFYDSFKDVMPYRVKDANR